MYFRISLKLIAFIFVCFQVASTAFGSSLTEDPIFQSLLTCEQLKEYKFKKAVIMDCNNPFAAISGTYSNFNECGDPGTFTFSAQVGSNSNIVANFPVPNDFVFAGNVTGGSLSSADPSISIIPDVSGGAISFTFDLQAQCGASDDETVNFSFDYIDADGMTQQCTFTSLPLVVLDVAVSIPPQGTPGRNTENTVISVLNEVDTLTTTVVQEGLANIDSLFFFVDDHPLMEVQSVFVCETGQILNLAATDGGRSYYWMDQMTVGVDGFSTNEGIDICTEWLTTDCPGTEIPQATYGAATSCSLDPLIDICQVSEYSATLDFGARVPEIIQYIDPTQPFDPTCIDGSPKTQRWILRNEGTAPAGSINAYVTEFGGQTPIDITSIVATIDGTPVTDITISNTTTGSFSACVGNAYGNSDDLASRFNVTFGDLMLDVDQELIFSYDIYPVPCGCGGCSVPRRFGVDIADFEIEDLCGTVVQEQLVRDNVAWPNFDVDLGSFMESPVTNCAGETSTLSTTVTNYTNSYLNNQGYNWQDDDERNSIYFNGNQCTDCYTEITFTLPNGLDYIPGSASWNDDDGSQWIPDMISYTDNDGGPDELILRWTGQAPNGVDIFSEASGIFFDYTPDCVNELAEGPNCSPVLYNDEITKSTVWSSGACAGCGTETIECETSLPVVIKCPGMDDDCQCDGFVHTDTQAARVNLYTSDPDNNGLPNEGDPYNEGLLRTDRFLKGDSIKVEMNGYVSANGGSFSNFDYVYAEVDFADTNFIPLGGEVTIFEEGGGSFTCTVLTQQIIGTTLVTDLSIPRLQANGCTTPTTYEHLDSFALTFYYTPTEQFTGDIQQLTQRTRMFASDEPYGGAEYTCRLPIDYRLSQVGVQSDFDYFNSGLVGFSGCATGTPYYRGYARLGSANVDYFPGEYINNVNFITNFETNIPSGTVFNYMRIYIRRKNAGGANNLGSTISGGQYPNNGIEIQASHPAITIVGSQLYFDMAAFLAEQNINGGTYPDSDEGYSWSIQPYFIATCNLEAGPVENAQMLATHQTSENLYCSTSYTFEDELTNLRYDGGAEILIAAVEDCISVDGFPTCSRVRVRNLGTSVANNTWLSFASQGTGFVFSSLTRITGGASDPVLGNEFNMFDLGNLNGNANELYELCMYVNTCEEEMLTVYSGYDCVNAPSILEEAICSSEDDITFKAVRGSLSMATKQPSEDTVLGDLCDTVTYVLNFVAAGPGFLSDLYLDMNLPLDVKYVPGSFAIAYPADPNLAVVPPDADFISVTDPDYLYGNTFRLEISENEPTLAETGLIGSAGSAFNTNVVNVRFDIETKCGFGSGSRIFFESNAKEGCGTPLVPIQKDFSKLIAVSNAPEPFISEIDLDDSALNACNNDQAPVTINYSISGSDSTTDEDSIRVILPAGISFVPGSYVQGTNPLPDPPVVQNSSGLNVVYWGINGLDPGSSAEFSFSIQANDIGQACKDYPITVQTFKSGIAYCDATDEDCAVRSISDEAVANIFIDKADLAITSISASSMANGADEMLTVEAEIINNGNFETAQGADLIVDLYDDVNNNGRVDNGDVIQGSLEFQVSLTPGESTTVTETITIPAGASCGLIAYIDIAKNCSCKESGSFQFDATLDLKLPDDVFVCSNETISIGPDNDQYTYEWISLGGSDLTALSPSTSVSPANFSYDNNTGQTIVWDYGLRVSRAQGCYTFDTITVHIYPETYAEISNQVCGPITDCGDTAFSFPLSGPLDGSDYAWSVDSGDASANINNADQANAMVDTEISETTRFRLDYLDANGCAAEFIQEVSMVTCACTALGDTVWYDFNVDGIQDDSEPGIPGITVYLYNNTDLSTPIQSTMTDADGFYVFRPLPQGNYVVRFDTLGNTAPYHQLVPTLQDQGNDEDDSDADTSSGFTGSYFVPNGISNWTVDAGFYPAFDLALMKEVDTATNPGPYFPGDVITYTISVYNQGGYYAGQNIAVTDLIPTGMSYDSGTDGSVTTHLGNTAQVTASGSGSFTIDELQPEDHLEISISLMMDSGFTGSSITNYAEISSFENEFDLPDVDSEADYDPTNDSGGQAGGDSDNQLDGDGNDDEDDHDPAEIEIEVMDLALMKKLNSSYNAEPIAIGELVKFDIIVINQGDIPVENVLVQDNVPAGYIFDENEPLNQTAGWNGSVQATIPGLLNPGERDTVCLYLEAQLASGSSDYINAAEIMAAYDPNTGRDLAPFDIDSTPGSDSNNENNVAPDSPGDNNISSTGNDQVGSEDDHDIEEVNVVFADLALTKMIDPSVDLLDIKYGDTIKYLITVHNQGTMIADSVVVHDYIPNGLSFDASISGNSVWNVDGSDAVRTYIKDLYPTAQKSVCLWLTLNTPDEGTDYTNVAEISEFFDQKGIDRSDEDIDSDLNSDPDDNAGGAVYTDADDSIDGDGTGNPGDSSAATDEDNSDPAILPVYDLALTKSLLTEGPYSYGDDLTYRVYIYNQGNVDAYNVEVTDSIPSGLGFDVAANSDWDDTSAPEVSYTFGNVISAGMVDSVDIVLSLEQANGASDYTNIAEIRGGEDADGNTQTDADSTGDNDSENDNGGEVNGATDDQVDGNGTDDEDDHDPAIVEIYDLALVKRTSQTGPFSYGDVITYEIEVYNQGSIDANNIVVKDSIPCGLSYLAVNDGVWTYDGTGSATTTISTVLASGESTTVSIQLEVQACLNGSAGNWTNIAEITSSEDTDGNDMTDEDIDSTSDDDSTNDGTSENDATDNSNGDEDDHDPEVIEIYDLALTKSLVTEGPYSYGDDLTYRVYIYNQGNVDAYNVEVTDSIPSGLGFDAASNSDWDDTALPEVSYTFGNAIAAGEVDSVDIILSLEQANGAADYTNIAEITGGEDADGNPQTDADSTGDNDSENDNGGEVNGATDDQVDGNGTDDEDDHDPAIVEIYDLALVKRTSQTGPFSYGDVITYEIEVYNQGSIDANNIVVKDSIPCGLSYLAVNDGVWTYDGTGSATTTISTVLASGESTTVSIQLEVQACLNGSAGNWTNIAEITSSEDTDGNDMTDEDIDSTADDDSTNDGTSENDATDNSNGDEDDHDPEVVEIYDLALTKSLVTEGPYSYGDDLTYRVYIYNQGNVDAYNVEVTDSIPSGLGFDAAANSDWDDTSAPEVIYTFSNVIPAGMVDSVDIVLSLEQANGAEDYTNIAEITGGEDADGNPQTDADSTGDNDSENDSGGEVTGATDDQVDGNGTDDEDDHDPAIVEFFDLATIKRISNLDAMSGFVFGDAIDYEILVINQGSIDASNITVVDYVPQGYDIDYSINPGWSGPATAPATLTYNHAGALASGDTLIIPISLIIKQVDNADFREAYTNTAEIADAHDGNGDDIEDIDSTPDSDEDNDGVPSNDITDNSDSDEDDHDIALPPFADLALKKTLAIDYTVINVGDDVRFKITVFNQGTMPLQNIEITDYVPNGLSYSTSDPNVWDDTNPSMLTKVLSDPLAAGDSISVEVVLTVGPFMVLEDYINYAEISSFEDLEGNMPMDFDSTPDQDPDNDPGAEFNTDSDDHILDDGQDLDGDGIRDEDDHDLEAILIFDLALKKTTDHVDPVLVGDDVKFDITVYNQGNIQAKDVKVRDYIPAGFALSPASIGWTSIDANNAEYTINEIPILDSITIEIVLTVQQGANYDNLINYAEISSAFDEFDIDRTLLDVDSTADSDPDNDQGGELYSSDDNYVDGNGKNNAGEDEDDHDPAQPPIFDLALIKYRIDQTPIIPGDIITHTIKIYNQGNIDATNITVYDYLPEALELSSTDTNGWTRVIDKSYEKTFAGLLAAGDSLILEMEVEVQIGAGLDNTTNFAEIFGADNRSGEDMTNMDIDSSPDGNEGNDSGGDPSNATDDMVNDDGRDTDGDGIMDEDDHDPAALPIFDLALRKTTALVPVEMGDEVEFMIEICNQGTENASNITIVDYIPVGLQYIADARNMGWDATDVMNPTYDYMPVINVGDCAMISIWLEVISEEPSELINYSEIVSAEDDMGNDRTGLDIDSVNDNDNTNDNGLEPYSDSDDEIDENGRAGEDEDDHDQAWLLVCEEIVCNAEINISLDEDCSTTFTPSMILSPATYPDYVYTVEIRDMDGNIRVDGTFTAADIGEMFFITVTLPLCDNISCWSKVTVEDKFAPVIDCPADMTIACTALPSVGEPTVMENCGDHTLTLLNETIDDLGGCDPDYIRRITRSYQATDAQGNVSEVCSFNIFLERIDLGDVVMPSMNFQALSNTALECTSGYAVDANGNPDPSVTGVPTYLGTDLFPDIPMEFCNGFVSYEDNDLGTVGCVRTITRTWTVGEWHCNADMTVMGAQIIQIQDNTAPIITCPSDMTVSTSGVNVCEAMVSLPSATAVEQCNLSGSNPAQVEIDVIYPGGFLDNENGGSVVLSTGANVITYVAYDECYNSSSCTMTVTVMDESQPIAICQVNTVVALNSAGVGILNAIDVDQGSFDDCGIDRFEIARMSDNCNDADNLVFGESVSFCCADGGSEQMVIFRVYDMSGNYNECMVSVEVQDKQLPSISCPADMTVECGTVFDPNNMSITFGDASVSDNCTSANAITEVVADNRNNCGLGVVERTISIPDGQGGTMSCTQRITFEDSSPYMGPSASDWPSDMTFNNDVCTMQDLHPDNLAPGVGYPIIDTGDACSQVAMSYVDQEFGFVPGTDACFKVLRDWTVIDWCRRNPDGTIPQYTYQQTLKVTNSIAPQITSSLADVVVETFDSNCADGEVSLVLTATDDCTATEDLTIRYEIDANNDGSIDISNNGNDASGTYPIGIHRIYWEVLDGCGNIVLGDYLFEVRNATNPTPVCIQGLSTELVAMDLNNDGIPDAEMVMLEASSFDGSSYHICGYPVTFSFSADVTDTEVIFDCNDLGQQAIELWVTDSNGNQDFCVTFVVVQDNNDVDICTAQGMLNISGQVSTRQSEPVEAVSVDLEGTIVPTIDTTSAIGMYSFPSMAMGGIYEVVPSKNDDPLNGVSTLDLVLIQKHILGIKSLEEGYDRIAADINGSEDISAVDLIELRKLLLGVYDEFPNNTSWRFVDKLHEFEDGEDPWYGGIPESYSIDSLSGHMLIDFVGVKVGDVNGSVEASSEGEEIEGEESKDLASRADNNLVLVIPSELGKTNSELSSSINTSARRYSIPVMSDNFRDVEGMQLEIETLEYVEITGLRSGSISVREESYAKQDQVEGEKGNSYKMIWTDAQSRSVTVGKEIPLFFIEVELSGSRIGGDEDVQDWLSIVESSSYNEWYSGEELQGGIEIRYKESEGDIDLKVEQIDTEVSLFELYQNEPNPWVDQTQVKFFMEERQEGILRIKDELGRVLYNREAIYDRGEHYIRIDGEVVHGTSGIYILELQVGEDIQRVKMIKMNN